MSTVLLILIVVVAVAIGVSRSKVRNESAKQMICPHCQQRGTVSVAPTKVKRGISGGKAMGALLTFGTSMLVTGLSRKERHLRARCSNCGVDWLI